MLEKIKGFILSHLSFDHIFKIIVAVSLVCIAQGVNAGVSGHVGVSSDYVWRGVSQHGGDYVLSASLGGEHESGLYGNVWLSEVELGDATHEMDTIVGMKKNLFGVDFDMAYIDYSYKGDSVRDFSEIMMSADFGMFKLSHFMGQDDAPDYMEISSGLLEIVDLSWGDHDGRGSHYKVSKSFDALGGNLTVGYTDFKSDHHSLSDETNLFVSYHLAF